MAKAQDARKETKKKPKGGNEDKKRMESIETFLTVLRGLSASLQEQRQSKY